MYIHHYTHTESCDLTVFLAYLTTFLIETVYEEPIKSVEHMLQSDMKDGSFDL